MSKNKKYIQVNVLNWDSYQRNDKNKKYRSLAFVSITTNFFRDEKIIRLTPETKLLFLLFLCESGSQNDSKTTFLLSFLTTTLQMRSKKLLLSLAQLKQFQLIDFFCCEDKLEYELNRTELNKDNSAPLETEPRKKAARKKPEPDHHTQKIYAHYCEEFKKLYGINPPRTKKDIGLIRNAFNLISLEDGSQLITAYFQSKENWFKTKGHDVATLVNNLSKLKINTVEIKKQVEKKENLLNMIDLIQKDANDKIK